MKRFTETTKWRDIWFRRLTPVQKCIWSLICDVCDASGVFEFDEGLFSSDVGAKVTMADLEALGDRIFYLEDSKWMISKFIHFQYGKLSHDCKPHKVVFSALEKHGLTPEDIDQNSKFKGCVTANIRERIIRRDGYRCVYTGVALLHSELEIDHIIPRSKGGPTKDHNLVCMDKKLNSLKLDRSLEEFCILAGLDLLDVKERISNALSKGIDTLQEQDKEEDKDKKKTKTEEEPKPKTATLNSMAKAMESEVREFCKANGLFPRDADYLWNRWEGNGWQNGGKPIKDWKSTIRSWKAQGYLPSQKTQSSEDFWPEDVAVNSQIEPETDLLAIWEANKAKKALESAKLAEAPQIEKEPSMEAF